MKLWLLIRRFLSLCWRALTRIRLALSNLLFLAMLAVIYFVYIGGGPEPLPERAALLLNPMGSIVDEKSYVEPLQALMGQATPADHEVLLRDVIDAIDFAREDPAINALVMDLDNLLSVGISKTQEIAVALEAFKASGKPIIAVGDYFSQGQYLLASYADTVILHPQGGVALEGFASYQNYFRDALEKLSVNMHVFKAGEHKSIAEPFLRNDMSPAEKEITGRWLGLLWQQYAETVEAQRELPAGSLTQYIDDFAGHLKAQNGDMAQTSLRANLVDEVMGRAEANDYLTEIVGAVNDDALYEAVVFERYVSHKRPLKLMAAEGDRVAVITAQGNIQMGEHPPGTIGGDSLGRLIRSTAKEDGVKAIVMRVNSGGGSVFASEVIRQEILQAKAAGMPVVISMGAVAASGGYYIAADADQIWATRTTITGSIGVFAAFPTFERLLERGGIHTDGVGTTSQAGSFRVDRPLSETLAQTLTHSVEFTYKSFVDLVAEGRSMTFEEVDNVAQGRVWSAEDALEHGLVDHLGGLNDAIAAAAAIAGTEQYSVDYVGVPLSPRDVLLQQLTEKTGGLPGSDGSTIGASLGVLLGPVLSAAREVLRLDDPANLYVRCISCGAIN